MIRPITIARDAMLPDIAPVDPKKPDPATVQANWAKAMDHIVTEAAVPVPDGTFRADLTWMDSLPSADYFVKVYASDAKNDAFGSVRIPRSITSSPRQPAAGRDPDRPSRPRAEAARIP